MILTESRKKSEMIAKTGFHLEKLLIEEPCFISCTYEESLEEITFSYEIDGLYPLSQLKSEEKKYQYQFLINFCRLQRVEKGYKIALVPDNIYYDDNYLPYIKNRDLYPVGQDADPENFLLQYKIFAGGILSKKYSVEQLQESGLEVLEREPGFVDFYEAQSVEDLLQVLKDRKVALLKKEKETTVRVDKTAYIVKSVMAVMASVFLLAAVGAFIYGFFYVIPRQQCVIKANEAYIRLDYVSCIDSMEDIGSQDMDISTKYILAVSYAKCESLKKEEMDTIISRLSLLSNEKELEYWIHIGRMEYTEAQEKAQALSDDKLLVYAYMKELNQLESDTNINGEEKQERISTLQNKIIQLGDKYTPEEGK
ncbi:MAG: hypothetical protein NC086_05905 [Alistipes sp.]|nr:hypothetical protein [Alistipes sp.]